MTEFEEIPSPYSKKNESSIDDKVTMVTQEPIDDDKDFILISPSSVAMPQPDIPSSSASKPNQSHLPDKYETNKSMTIDHSILFDTNYEYIKISEISTLFPRLELLTIVNVKLCTSFIDKILAFLQSHKQTNLKSISIERIDINSNLSLPKALSQYQLQFNKIGQILVADSNNHALCINKQKNIDIDIDNVALMKSNQTIKQDRYDHIEAIEEKSYIFPREYKDIGPVFPYGKKWPKDIKPLYAHLKEEVLNNKYSSITEKTWNGVLRKCHKILKGQFSDPRKNEWSKLLRDNKIGMKHLVALKLYVDFDPLQREFRKAFRAPYNRETDRLQSFYHWRKALQETFEKFTNIPSALRQPNTLFHGVNSIYCIDQYEGVYYGPCSTTTDLTVARNFAGKHGMILVMKPETNVSNTDYKALDISWISDYPDEREYLLLDHRINIETWILSSDYDQYYLYYRNIFSRKKPMEGPRGHRSYQQQMKIPKYLTKLKLLIEDEVISTHNQHCAKTNKHKIKIKQNVNFGKDTLDKTEKMELLMWIFKFALSYKYTQIKPSKFDQSLNANIQHTMKRIHVLQVPSNMIVEFMEKVNNEYKKELSLYFIRSVLNDYFINSYVPLC